MRRDKEIAALGVFQHTAARRRLGELSREMTTRYVVSTHSRPKAAGPNADLFRLLEMSFNTQPPEGGWKIS